MSEINEMMKDPGGQFVSACLAKVCERFGLSDNADNKITEFAHPAFGDLGHMRVISGGKHPQILKVIQMTLKFPPLGADAHALHIVTKPDSVLPHFSAECIYYDPTVDSPLSAASDGPANFGFYINLISRVDPGSNLDYMEHVYGPLTEAHQSIIDDDEVEMAELSRNQKALFQPWVIVCKANPKLEFMQGIYKDYLHRCADLIDTGLPSGMVSAEDIARSPSRDAINRHDYLSPRVDHIWPRIDQMIGEENGVRMRQVLTSQEVETSW